MPSFLPHRYHHIDSQRDLWFSIPATRCEFFCLDSFGICSAVRLTWNVFCMITGRLPTQWTSWGEERQTSMLLFCRIFKQWIRRENVIKFCIFVSALTWWMGKIWRFLQVSACWSYQVTLRSLWHIALDQRCPNQGLWHRFGLTCQDTIRKT